MKYIALVLLLFYSSSATALDTIRICSYNVLSLSSKDKEHRRNRFIPIMAYIKPDVLIGTDVEDITGAGTLTYALSLAHGLIPSFMPFHDGPDTDNMIAYNRNRIYLEEYNKYVPTNLRDISVNKIRSYNGSETISIFGVNFTDGNTPEGEAARLKEVKILKKLFPENEHFIITGTFNFYSSTESGYLELMGDSLIIDPLGAWQRDSPHYAQFYTTSTRKQSNTWDDCGQGSPGGMTDRLDFIFFSKNLADNYVPLSFTIVGNDGIDRRGLAIDNPANLKYQQLAADLRCASDHLPLFADFVLNKPVSVANNEGHRDIKVIQTSESISISFPYTDQAYNQTITVTDILGRTILLSHVYEPYWTLERSGLPRGVYIISVYSDKISMIFPVTILD